ncbi:LysR family transcriptional regulator [Falsirhodobacter deserti]|uniref:LysR family transcriptional regulator n=1 Tax=Falsirhodobacter deserti TaxID=1365611 RepID=UPI000FE29F1A|nr:LysR family transcriptional regulator [Falsirhodobacter deserti]
MDKVLVQFLAIADEGTFSGAAASLNVTQPTLTFNIKKLEQQFGVDLFERSSRGVTLTDYGRTLYQNVTVMHRLYRNAVDSIERQRIHREEGLSIGTGYSWWALFLKDLVADYSRRSVTGPVNVSVGNALRCMDQLLAGDISMFIGHRIENLVQSVQPDFLQVGLVRDGHFVRQDHPLLERPRTQAEVLEYPSTLAFPPEARQQRLLLDHPQGHADARQPEYAGRAFTSNSLEACLDYVRTTNAVLAHTDLMAPEFARKGIRMVPMRPGEEPAWRPVGIYILPERREDKHVARLLDVILQKTREVVQNT